MSAEATQKNYDLYVRQVQENTQVPGFRKGQRVPLPLLIQTRGGEKAFNGEVLQGLIERSAEKALKKWDAVAIADSDRLETNVQDLLKTFQPDEPLQFSISFDVMSEIKWTSPYRQIKVDVDELGNEETDAATVERYLRELLKEKGMQRIVMGRGLDVGDIAIVDVDFARPDNGESLPHLRQEKFSFDTDRPDTLGMIGELKGIRPGDVRTFDVTFPDNWEPSIYRGLETVATVTCHELFSWDLPELTDEMVKSLNQPSLQGVEDLRSSMLLAESNRRAERLKDTIQDALMKELASIVDMTVSETALIETAKVKYQTVLLEMQSKGGVSREALESLASEPMLNNYMKTHRAELENDQKAIAAMQAVFKDLELTVTEEELNAEISEAQRGFKEIGEEYDDEKLREMAVDVLQNVKVVEWFVKNGNVNVLPYKTAVTQS